MIRKVTAVIELSVSVTPHSEYFILQKLPKKSLLPDNPPKKSLSSSALEENTVSMFCCEAPEMLDYDSPAGESIMTPVLCDLFLLHYIEPYLCVRDKGVALWC